MVFHEALLEESFLSFELDYIKGIHRENVRAARVKELRQKMTAREIEVFADTTGDCQSMALVRPMKWDSDFFNFPVYKIETIVNSKNDVSIQAIDAARAALQKISGLPSGSYVFTVIDSRESINSQALGRCGFSLIETRLNYYRDLSSFNPTERFATKLAKPEDLESLAEASAQMVNRFDRFHADPLIGNENAERLMRKWIEASLLEGFADGILTCDQSAPKAFCSFKLHRDQWPLWEKKIAQPVFSAVSIEMKGWYYKIISELTLFLKNQGAEFSYLTTQSTNGAVVHTWEKLGYKYGSCDLVFSKRIP